MRWLSENGSFLLHLSCWLSPPKIVVSQSEEEASFKQAEFISSGGKFENSKNQSTLAMRVFNHKREFSEHKFATTSIIVFVLLNSHLDALEFSYLLGIPVYPSFSHVQKVKILLRTKRIFTHHFTFLSKHSGRRKIKTLFNHKRRAAGWIDPTARWCDI